MKFQTDPIIYVDPEIKIINRKYVITYIASIDDHPMILQQDFKSLKIAKQFKQDIEISKTESGQEQLDMLSIKRLNSNHRSY